MAISSISNNWLYYPHTKKHSTASTTGTADSQSDDIQSLSSTDTDQNDTSAQALFSGVMSQGLLPVSSSDDDGGTNGTDSDMSMAMMMPPPPSMDTTSATDNEDAISAFLDKVQSGTATATDVSSIQDYLNQATSQTADTQTASSTSTTTDSSLTIQSFLDKVKDGTVTDSDLSAMQALLSTTQVQSGMMPPPPPKQTTDGNSVGAVSQSQLVSAIQSYENTGTVNNDNSSLWSS